MDIRMKLLCYSLLFCTIFGVQFPTVSSEKRQLRTYPHHIALHQQPQTVTIPIPKDLLSNQNQLRPQSHGPRPPYPEATIARDLQRVFFTNWPHIPSGTQEEWQASSPQKQHGKNCKRRKRPATSHTTTNSPYHALIVTSTEPTARIHLPLSVDKTSEEFFNPSPNYVIPSGQTILKSFITVSPGFLTAQQAPTLTTVFENESGFTVTKDTPIEEYSTTKTPHVLTTKFLDQELFSTAVSIIPKSRITKQPDHKIYFTTSTTSLPELNLFTVIPTETTKTNHTETPPTETTKTNHTETPPEKIQVPNTPERIREPLAALEKDHKRTQLRNKEQREFVGEVTVKYKNNNKSYRRPYSQARRAASHSLNTTEVRQNRSSSNRSIALKEILKNAGGLSLSEILQQKNLSLDDLLKGKQNALLVLQTTASAPPKLEKEFAEKRPIKPLRRVTSTTTTTTRRTPTTTTTTTTATTPSTISTTTTDTATEARTTYLTERDNYVHPSSVDDHSENKHYNLTKNGFTINLQSPHYNSRIRMKPVTRKPLTTEPTPQHKPSRYTTTTKLSTTTTSYKNRHYTRGSHKHLTNFSRTNPATFPSKKNSNSAEVLDEHQTKLNVLVKNSSTQVEDLDHNTVPYQTTEKALKTTSPVPPTPQQEAVPNITEPTTDHIYRFNSKHNHIDKNINLHFSNTDSVITESPDDRTDLLELIEDHLSGNHLIKILQQRNMSLEELIEHRKRGFVQPHLATFLQNHTGIHPTNKVELSSDMDIVTAFESFPQFNLINLKSIKPDDIKTDSEGSSYFTSITDIEPTDEVLQSPNKAPLPKKPILRTINGTADISRRPFYPSWKSLALASFVAAENGRRLLQQRPTTKSWTQSAQRHQVPKFEENSILQIEDDALQDHDLVDLELSGHGFKRSANLMYPSQIPSSVRSAIVASGVVVLISLTIFIIIFAACRWKARRRRYIEYFDSYNVKESKLPVISARRSLDISTMTTNLSAETNPGQASGYPRGYQNISTISTGANHSQLPTNIRSKISSKINAMRPKNILSQESAYESFQELY